MEDTGMAEKRPLTSGSGHASTASRPRSRNGGTPSHLNKLDLVAQMSLAPATQTTVVTTTTTTTINYPPFIMPAPNKKRDHLNAKRYPLHNNPTPQSLQNIVFKLGGKSTVFQEASDSTLAVESYRREHKKLRRANGKIQTIETDEPIAGPGPATLSNLSRNRSPHEPRPASPESIRDPESEGEFDSAAVRKRRKLTQQIQPPAGPKHSRIRDFFSSPITPQSQQRLAGSSRRLPSYSNNVRSAETVLPTPTLEQRAAFLSGNNGAAIAQDYDELDNAEADDFNGNASSLHRYRGASHDTAVPTPPVDSEERTTMMSGRALSSIPARLHVDESPSAQDGSLPSPSLSPVTAAATFHGGSYFANVGTESDSERHPYASSRRRIREYTPSGSEDDTSSISRQIVPHQNDLSTPNFSSFSLTEIPPMLDYFEAIPDELKGYVMHQLLRRCPKSTLQVVADVVNPALKCDFLTALPPELGFKIVDLLDLSSLCRAAQVSRAWRFLINQYDQVWKDLFKADGFTLPEGEYEQALLEGWEWQDPSGIDGCEVNIHLDDTSIKTERDTKSPQPDLSPAPVAEAPRRSKRKAASALSSKHRQVKRKKTTRSSRETSYNSAIDGPEQTSTPTTMDSIFSTITPATIASNVGLPSLQCRHMQKSLYRRHYLIRRNWMHEDTKPRHIAFRAHDTHVVTCLQFDSEKILTGSDDNNINVYDTKTGGLRTKLIGHEGGVWALQYVGNTLVSGSTDRSVRVWDIERGEERQVFRGHTSTVRCLQIVMPVQVGRTADDKPIMMPRHPLIITGSRDSTLRVWKLPRPDDRKFVQSESEAEPDDCPWFVRTLTGHQHSVRAIAAHGDTLVSGSYDFTVRVWRISTGESMLTLRGHAQKVYSVVLDHQRNRCISGSMDNMVRIWDLDTGSLRYSLEGHSSLVGLLDLQCDRLVSAAADSTLRIWDPENGNCKATLTAHTGAITCFQHDGQKVISGSDRTLKLWDIKKGECVKDLLSDLSGVWQVRFDERRCVSAVQRDGVTFIEVLDFGAARDGIPASRRGRRIVIDADGNEEGLAEDES